MVVIVLFSLRHEIDEPRVNLAARDDAVKDVAEYIEVGEVVRSRASSC